MLGNSLKNSPHHQSAEKAGKPFIKSSKNKKPQRREGTKIRITNAWEQPKELTTSSKHRESGQANHQIIKKIKNRKGAKAQRFALQMLGNNLKNSPHQSAEKAGKPTTKSSKK